MLMASSCRKDGAPLSPYCAKSRITNSLSKLLSPSLSRMLNWSPSGSSRQKRQFIKGEHVGQPGNLGQQPWTNPFKTLSLQKEVGGCSVNGMGMLPSSQLCSRASPVGYTDNLVLTSHMASAFLSGHRSL